MRFCILSGFLKVFQSRFWCWFFVALLNVLHFLRWRFWSELAHYIIGKTTELATTKSLKYNFQSSTGLYAGKNAKHIAEHWTKHLVLRIWRQVLIGRLAALEMMPIKCVAPPIERPKMPEPNRPKLFLAVWIGCDFHLFLSIWVRETVSIAVQMHVHFCRVVSAVTSGETANFVPTCNCTFAKSCLVIRTHVATCSTCCCTCFTSFAALCSPLRIISVALFCCNHFRSKPEFAKNARLSPEPAPKVHRSARCHNKQPTAYWCHENLRGHL